MDDRIIIRRIEPNDHDFVLELNKSNERFLIPMNKMQLEFFAENAELFKIACFCGSPAGFLIALSNNTQYDYMSFRWFSERFSDFLYIDRVAVDGRFRGMGIGKLLYQTVFDHAVKNATSVIAAAVAKLPRNIAGLEFHRSMGFKEAGEQSIRGGSYYLSQQTVELAK